MDSIPKILIVDDYLPNIISLEKIFSDLPYELFKATSADEALKMVLKYPFSLILLDVQMPGMNGYEVARLLQKNSETRKIPIIFVTANFSDIDSEIEGYSAGAIDYMVKPINAFILKQKVSVLCNIDRTNKELAHLNNELMDANEKIKKIEDSKQRFFSNMTHELRSPLHAILAFSAAENTDCLDMKDEVKVKKNFEMINISAVRMLHLVNELLDIAKIESGNFTISKNENDIIILIESVIGELSPLANKKGIVIDKQFSSSEMVCRVDHVRMYQVFVNVLSNAIKFSSKDSRILISLTRKNDKVVIDFSDEGSGIDNSSLVEIFGAYSQSDKSAKNAEGTGLGLAITKYIIEKHNGTILAKNNDGLGATFTITLPIN